MNDFTPLGSPSWQIIELETGSFPLQGSFAFAIAVQSELLPERFRVLPDLFQSGQAKASDTGTANRMPGAFWRGRMSHRIKSASGEASVTC